MAFAGGMVVSPRQRGEPAGRRRRAYFVGDPAMIAEKALRVSEQLGGVDRIDIQMTNPRLAHADLLHSIELLGTEVLPLVEKG